MTRELLNRHDDRQFAGANTAIFAGKWHGEDILLGQQLFHIPGEFAGMVNFCCPWRYPFQRYFSNRLYKCLFIFAEMGHCHV